MLDRRRWPVVVGLVVAALTTIVVVRIANTVLGPPAGPGDPRPIAKGEPAPLFSGTTLDGAAFDLVSLRGRPVIVNFWGPSCVPCRDEFPLLKAKIDQHADTGLTVVGVLMFDAPAPARDFIAAYGASWPTVDDPDGDIRAAYRAVARPQSYFIDAAGVLRAIQVGELTDEEFERHYALIADRPAASP